MARLKSWQDEPEPGSGLNPTRMDLRSDGDCTAVLRLTDTGTNDFIEMAIDAIDCAEVISALQLMLLEEHEKQSGSPCEEPPARQVTPGA